MPADGSNCATTSKLVRNDWRLAHIDPASGILRHGIHEFARLRRRINCGRRDAGKGLAAKCSCKKSRKPRTDEDQGMANCSDVFTPLFVSHRVGGWPCLLFTL